MKLLASILLLFVGLFSVCYAEESDFSYSSYSIPGNDLLGNSFVSAYTGDSQLFSYTRGNNYNYVYTADFLNGILPGNITFTRASNATYFNSSGVLTTASTDQPRFDYYPTPRTNLISNTDISTWTKTNSTVSTLTDTDGSTFYRAQSTTGSGVSRVYIDQLNPLVSGSIYTGYVDLRADSPTTFSASLRIRWQDGSQVVTSVTPTTTWTRYYISGTNPSTNDGQFHVFLNPNGLSGLAISGSTLDIRYPQLELGTTPTAFIPTSGTAVTVYDPRGLLVELQRTNLLTYGSDFSNGSWAPSAVSVTATSIMGPDGETSAYAITENVGVGGAKYIQKSFTGVSGTTYTMSVYAKAASATVIQLAMFSTPLSYANFNLSTGNVGLTGFSSATMTPLSNGWYRCAMTVTSGQTGGTAFVAMVNSDQNVGRGPAYTGTGQTAYLWGGQTEAGNYATSYIPTSSATATRTADSAIISILPTIGYNQAQGTVYTESELEGIGATGTFAAPASFSNSSNSLISILFSNGGMRYKGYVYASGVEQANFFAGGTISPFTTVRLAFGFADNNMALYVNGSGASDMAGTIPQVTNLYIGSSYTSNQQLGGWIKRINYYPTRLPDATLQQLTQ